MELARQAAAVPITFATAVPWLVRGTWLVLPFSAGPVLATALDARSAAVAATASTGLWLAWALVVIAVLVPSPLGLTALRVAASTAVAVVLAAAPAAGSDGVASAVAGATTTVVAALAFTPAVGAWMVNGAAYGNERRHLLRPPLALLVAPIPLAWAGLVSGVTAGPLLLASGRWVAGTVALAAGAPVAVVLARALHSLAARWAVLVPAGLVLKDHLALVDPVLLRRVDVEVLRPASPGSDALDLTAGAPGLALEVRLREAVPLTRVVPGRRKGETGRSAAVRFTPTRPGLVLVDARARRIPVA